MKMKKVLALGLIAMMSTAAFAGCGSSESSDGGSASTGDSDSASASGQVYYLNFKPEADEAWQEIAAQYRGDRCSCNSNYSSFWYIRGDIVI